MMHGRRKPYTDAGIRRLPCIRCGKKAHATWQVCADGGMHRPLCESCDVALNELVLKWAGFPDWQAKMAKYMNRRTDEQPKEPSR